MSTVAERMLEVLPDESAWAKGALLRQLRIQRVGVEDEVYATMCLLGAYGKATRDDVWYYHRNMGDGDEYLTRVARIAREQFPERFNPGFPWDRYDVVIVIVSFNDHDDTSYPDVRLVLEKAAAQ